MRAPTPRGTPTSAWTRITPWRALLAAALDQVDGKVTGVSVTAERVSPSADLLGAWLVDRLKAPMTRKRSDGPGITEVVAQHPQGGDIRIARGDGREATLSVPGQPDRPVALRRRDVPELLTEELRRLDPDDVYAATVRRLQKMNAVGGATKKAAARRPASKGSRSEGLTVRRRPVHRVPRRRRGRPRVADRVLELLATRRRPEARRASCSPAAPISRKVHADAGDPDRGRASTGRGSSFWWGDERYVPSDDTDRNAGQAWEDLLRTAAARRRSGCTRCRPRTTTTPDAEAAAWAYGQELRARGPPTTAPWFDVLMLGIGPDGHCASLFPGPLRGRVRGRRARGARLPQAATHPHLDGACATLRRAAHVRVRRDRRGEGRRGGPLGQRGRRAPHARPPARAGWSRPSGTSTTPLRHSSTD